MRNRFVPETAEQAREKRRHLMRTAAEPFDQTAVADVCHRDGPAWPSTNQPTLILIFIFRILSSIVR